jgi:hypothetical protein
MIGSSWKLPAGTMIRNYQAFTRRQLVSARRVRLTRIAKMERTLARLRTDVGRLEAAIEANGGAIRAYTAPLHPAPRGGVARPILGILRLACRPMTTGEITAALAVAEPWTAPLSRAELPQRVRASLQQQQQNGAVRHERGAGRRAMWEIAW